MNRTEELLVQAIALCDERTLWRYLRAERIRRSSRERIEAALRQLGLERFLRADLQPSDPPRAA